MDNSNNKEVTSYKQADWEIDFYSRPVMEKNGKKRWELLITTTEDLSGNKPFRWVKKCPASNVNSLWLSEAFQEAILESNNQGWGRPLKLRCWRSSMKTMIRKASSSIDLEIVGSRRTYSLNEWISEREEEIYPNEEGYMNGPIAPPPSLITNQPVPLPENVRGDKWSLASLQLGALREAQEWPIEFGGLIPINKDFDDTILIPGIRLFSQNRSLALAGWLGGLEPVQLTLEGNKLLLEAGQEDRWLVTDLDSEAAKSIKKEIDNTKINAGGLQFIAVQKSPEELKFSGFWMLRAIDLK